MGVLDDILLEADSEFAESNTFTTGSGSLDSLLADVDSEMGLIKPQEAPSGLDATAGQIGKGLAFGLFDEIQGVEAGARNKLLNLFGYGNDKSFGENYAETVKPLRQRDAAYESANPVTSTALQMTGAALPAIFTGGTGLAAKGGTSLIPGAATTAKTLFGVGLKGAPTAGQLAKMGAAQGALYGFGEANEGNRLAGAGVGAGVGAVAAPIIGKGLEKGGNYLGDKLAEWGIIGGRGLASTGAERGSFSNVPTGERALTPDEIFVARQLKNTPLEKIQKGAQELAETSAEGVPLFLPEAVQSPKVERNARFIANYEPSMEFSQDAIIGRSRGAEQRASQLFGQISDEADPYTGALKLRDAASGILEDATKKRQELVDPLYKAAYKERPVVVDPALDNLLEKDQALSAAIKAVKKTANNADLPDNSTQILVKARSKLSDKIAIAQAKGENTEARDLIDTYNRLNKILHKNETLKIADATFASESGGIEGLQSTFLSNLSRISDDKIKNVSQIFDLPASRIAQLRSTFEQAGKLSEWDAGVRSYLQTVAESSREGVNFTNKIANTTTLDERLAAALGDKYSDIAKGLSYEDRFFKGKNAYNTGSTTATNLAEGKSFQEVAGVLGNLKQGNWKEAFASLFNSDMPEELAQQVARIYFDPKRGADAMKRIQPLLEQYAKNKAVAGAVGGATGQLAAREAAAGSGAAQRPSDELSGFFEPTSAKASLFSEKNPSLFNVEGAMDNAAPQAEIRQVKGKEVTRSEYINKLVKNEGYTKQDAEFEADAILSGEINNPKVNLVRDMKVKELPAEFEAEVEKIGKDLDTDPTFLKQVMHFETGGTFDPAQKNKAGSGATGLIQFMPSTAKSLTGASDKDAAIKILESMTPIEQLEYVKKYLKPFKGKLDTLEDVYMAVLYPKAVGKDPEYALFREGTKAYWQNRGLDIDKDGKITKAEATAKVRDFWEDDTKPINMGVADNAIQSVAKKASADFFGALDQPNLIPTLIGEAPAPSLLERGKQGVELAANLSPGLGDVLSVKDAINSFKEGDYGMAALATVGALPMIGAVGDAAKGAIKVADKVGDAAKAGDSALDMSKAARMARAEEMGFLPETFYHGTADDFISFDKTKGGKVTKHPTAKEGIYLTDKPSEASYYANWAKGEKNYDAIKGSKIDLKSSANILPAKVKLENPLIYDAGARELSLESLGYRIAEAKEAGHDGLIVFSENPDYGLTKWAIPFDSKQVRSIFAKFDPKKADSSDLLASVAPLGALGLFGLSKENAE